MLRSLHFKLSLSLLLLLCIAGAALIPLGLSTTRAYSAEVSQRLNRDLAGRLATHLSQKGFLTARFASDKKLQAAAGAEISYLMTLNPDIEIYILDARGSILSSSIKSPIRRPQVSLGPLQQFLSPNARLPLGSDDPRQLEGRKVFSAARIPTAPNSMDGFVYIILGGQESEAAAASIRGSYVLRLGAWSVAGVLAVTFASAVALFALLTRRRRRLAQAVEEFGAASTSGASTPPRRRSRDEIAALEAIFASGSARVGAQVQRMTESDASRREAVSNVSHDLRTPLAALQGYLETLLMKEGQIGAEEQRGYLTNALRHAERLGKLIAALFELAKLDAREAVPELEEFSLGELVQDVAQQFQLAARNKGVTLGARLNGQAPDELPFVRADIALVERALENLIENALHHTPAGGTIEIALERRGERVQVQVRDTGEGIRAEDLPRIFERTFRAHDPSHSADDSGAGLGLAITRRIVELHGGEISAQSEPGQGAAFTFSLPLATRAST